MQSFSGKFQIVNPVVEEHLTTPTIEEENLELIIQYPTVSTVPGNIIKTIHSKVPRELYKGIKETLPAKILQKRNLILLNHCFEIIHGISNWSLQNESLAKNRLIYEEFYREQIKIHLRRKRNDSFTAPILDITDQDLEQLIQLYPYQLTLDQQKVLFEIKKDLKSGIPMMRLLQGDVGCGKTTIAVIAALISIKNNHQSALMCPTESLAGQHYRELQQILKGTPISISLLLGSTPQKEKNEIYEKLRSGKIDFIVGTHSLIQDQVQFKKLGIAIIDEQHKFGVNQRIKLSSKSEGTHTLIMTATPIPRSLSLTQYGDLNVSTIKTMPKGRKGHKTKIVTPQNFKNFLTFINTRLGMGEQVYVVVPAIVDNPEQNFLALEKVLVKFRKLFPAYIVNEIHGQMKPDEKKQALVDFASGKTNLLVSTSVIEVGINVTNATVMSIMNPERFGLSSLHQLRGRVGRGDKPGFCFLVTDKTLSKESLSRLQVIENNTDGFKIAEEDLKIRGEGELFGEDQSGHDAPRKMANILHHYEILCQAKEDLDYLISNNDDHTKKLIELYQKDKRIFSTI